MIDFSLFVCYFVVSYASENPFDVGYRDSLLDQSEHTHKQNKKPLKTILDKLQIFTV